MPKLDDRTVLIIATDRFEESELFGPKEILEDAGAKVVLASLDTKPIQGTVHDDPGKTIKPDLTVEEVEIGDYDALILPGGVGNPDRLRTEKSVIDTIRRFAETGKPVAAICHGPWLLVEAGLVDGKKVTSWPSIRTDLKNAGGDVVDEEAVTSGNIVTSRNPDDVPAFTQAIIDLMADADVPA